MGEPSVAQLAADRGEASFALGVQQLDLDVHREGTDVLYELSIEFRVLGNLVNGVLVQIVAEQILLVEGFAD